NKENIRRHGFDFADAWDIFEAPMRTALDLREDYGVRPLEWNQLFWKPNCSRIFTYRGENTRRIISLRKALKNERKKFEEAIGNRLGEN
ncbi:MAG: BrnT family toxin, partial [Pyrinomonadaceae bacterium]